MLYNQTWDKPVKTPEQLMDLSSIIKWLEQQPFWKWYVYADGHNCLLAKYYKAHGYGGAAVGSETVYLDGTYCGEVIAIPKKMDQILYGSNHFMGWRSFRRALKQARLLLAEEERAYAL